jgi:hypothetical protein
MGFQVSIDEGVQTQFQFNGVCDSDVNCNIAYNFTAYNIQSLHSGNHTLDLTLLNATGSNTFGDYTIFYDDYSVFYFEYAVVNETDTFPTPTISSTAPTSTTSTTAPTSPAPSTTQ